VGGTGREEGKERKRGEQLGRACVPLSSRAPDSSPPFLLGRSAAPARKGGGGKKERGGERDVERVMLCRFAGWASFSSVLGERGEGKIGGWGGGGFEFKKGGGEKKTFQPRGRGKRVTPPPFSPPHFGNTALFFSPQKKTAIEVDDPDCLSVPVEGEREGGKKKERKRGERRVSLRKITRFRPPLRSPFCRTRKEEKEEKGEKKKR